VEQIASISVAGGSKGLALVLLPPHPAGTVGLEALLPRGTDVLAVQSWAPRHRWALVRPTAAGLGDLPSISLADSPILGWRAALKRAVDLAVAGPLLALAAPLLGLIALAVKLSSPGPALYWQVRTGHGGRPFWLVKFRTMHADAERDSGPVWAGNHDPRCTRLGSFLRRTSLDELPQLWNVLKGEMSLVGPRPERPVFVDRFRQEVPRYMLRHSVKSGMTGWAQVNGWRGNTSIERRTDHDLEYIESWSLALDLRILWRTLAGGFLNPHAR